MALTGTHTSLWAFLFLAIPLYCMCSNELAKDELKEFQLAVKPGGQSQIHAHKFGKFECIFEYTCQGGTVEEWTMTLTRSSDKKHYDCIVHRPGGRSYLFFQKFTVSAKGANFVHGTAYTEGDRQLEEDVEYRVDYGFGVVQYMEGFKSSLSKVHVAATTVKRQEL